MVTCEVKNFQNSLDMLADTKQFVTALPFSIASPKRQSWKKAFERN
jgi:hypothetical protein